MSRDIDYTETDDLDNLDDLDDLNDLEEVTEDKLPEEYAAPAIIDPAPTLIIVAGYAKTFRAEPNNAERHFQYGRQFLQSGNYFQAVKALARALRIKPQWAEAQFYYAEALAANGYDLRLTLAAYNRALILDPKLIEAEHGRILVQKLIENSLK